MEKFVDSETTHQLLGKLVERTEYVIKDIQELKTALATTAIRTEARLVALELKGASMDGGTRMVFIFGGIAAALGGMVSHFVGKFWP